MDNYLIHNLRKSLLNLSKMNDHDLFDSLVKVILNTTGCSVCSLWGINNNNTNGGFQSASLIARELKEGLLYDFIREEDYVHDLKECFIKDVLNATMLTLNSYYICSKSDCLHHKSPECIKTLGLKYFIGIPIPDHDVANKSIAVLKLSYTEDPHIEDLDLFSNILSDYISASLRRYMLLQKQQIMDDLIINYKKNGQRKNVTNIFKPIIDDILGKYCSYEGASFFIWDSYMNRYKLLVTTGLIDVQSDRYSDVFYQSGEGLTGQVVEIKSAKIYDNLDNEKRNSDHIEKWKESTVKVGKTMMIIPLLRPSNGKDVIGILRFINKTNSKNHQIVDYFNDVDLELISYASNYIALSIDYFLGEEIQNDYISKLSHEVYTPAHSIHKTAYRLLSHLKDPDFLDRNLTSYIEDILFYAEFQKWQARTNLYLSKNRLKTPLAKKYKVTKCSLKELIQKSRSIVIPIARNEKVSFNNIVVDPNMPNINLFIDSTAFITVFYNLLNNAVKYQNPNVPFYVGIAGLEIEDSIIINILDYGLGITKGDQRKIFQVGYRGENVTQYNNNGFGVGLPVVKQIINDFGGEINVVNLKSPTKFEIKLPKDLLNINYTMSERWKK